jgi:hypothetical protein
MGLAVSLDLVRKEAVSSLQILLTTHHITTCHHKPEHSPPWKPKILQTHNILSISFQWHNNYHTSNQLPKKFSISAQHIFRGTKRKGGKQCQHEMQVNGKFHDSYWEGVVGTHWCVDCRIILDTMVKEQVLNAPTRILTLAIQFIPHFFPELPSSLL